MPAVERRIEAFLSNDDSPDISNPIHSTEIAQQYGFRGALVGGVTVWGWATPAILEALDESWLDRGWADVFFRQPVYPGDQLAISVTPGSDLAEDGYSLTMTNQDGVVCVVGSVGLGDAPWLDEYLLPSNMTPAPSPTPLPSIALGETQVGVDWVPVAIDTGPEEMDEYWERSHPEPDPRFTEASPRRLHPGWIAGRAERLLRHNVTLPQSIHFRSRIQHLAPAYADQVITTGAHLFDIHDRKGHHVANFDCLVRDASGTDVALLRHWTIIRVAKPEERGQPV
jgi:acyl dehydratase